MLVPSFLLLSSVWRRICYAKSLQLFLTLCDPIDGSQPGSPVPGILQAGTLEWVAISSPMHESEKWKWCHSVVSDSQRPYGLQPNRLLRLWDFPNKSTGVGCHCLLHRFNAAAAAKSLHSCLTLCNPIDGSPPGSPVPGILQARTLEWVATSFSNAWKWKEKVKSFKIKFIIRKLYKKNIARNLLVEKFICYQPLCLFFSLFNMS